MSETYVVTLTKLMHAVPGYSVSDTRVMGSAWFVVDDWSTKPEQRDVIRDAAESFFYLIAEALVEYEITEPLINETPASAVHDSIYWGEYIAEDDANACAWQVSIFRHYFSETRLS